MTTVFDEGIQRLVRQRFAAMKNPVALVHFTQLLECEACGESLRYMQDLVKLSDKLTLEVHDFELDPDAAARYGVDKIPATAVISDKDHGIRLYGLPSGYEFAVLLEAILLVSTSESGLSDSTKAKLRTLDRPVHVQVFTTPTCPYCPAAAHLAHRLALESGQITADVIEATQFPELARGYRVRGVPHTIINETTSINGALPEEEFVEQLLAAVMPAAVQAGNER
jgi:glutaredoxin-like protein